MRTLMLIVNYLKNEKTFLSLYKNLSNDIIIKKLICINHIVIFSLVIAMTTGCNEESSTSKKIGAYGGEWVKTRMSYSFDNEDPTRFSIYEDSTESIEIFSNQAYVYIDYGVHGDSLVIRYDGPADMGRGGFTLPWNEFSTDRPLAVGQVIDKNNNFLYVKWKGFHNRKRGVTAPNSDVNRISEKKYAGVYRKVGSGAEVQGSSSNNKLHIKEIASFLFSQDIYLGQAREDTEIVLGRPHDVGRSQGYPVYRYRAFMESHIARYTILYKAGRVNEIIMDVVDSKASEAVIAKTVLLGAQEDRTLLRKEIRSYTDTMYFHRIGDVNIENIVSPSGSSRVVMYRSKKHPYSSRRN